MTLETSECNGVSEGSKAEFEGKGVVDLVDGKRSGEDNGIGCGETEDVNGNVKDDVDGSYVFVNGETDEITERDLDVNGKVDLGASESVETNVETVDLSERDLGENTEVQTRIPEIEVGVVESGGLTATAHTEVEEGASQDKESGDRNEEKEASNVLCIEEVHCVEREKGELILENGRNCEEIGGPNLDSDLVAPNNREETPVTDVVVEYCVAEPVSVVENEVSCEEEGCGESFVGVVCKHDDVNGEIVMNGEVEDKVDGDSLDASSNEIEAEDSEAVVTGTAESASWSLVNGMEIVSSDAEEKIPALEQSEVVVAVSDGSDSLLLENEGGLAPNDAENSPKEQAKTENMERSESESLPPVDEEKLVTLNPEEDIPAVEQSAQSRIDSESEIQSRVNLGEKSLENSESTCVDTISDVQSEADEGNTAEESSESMPSSLVESPDAGGDATEDLVEGPEKLSACPVDDKGLEVESFVENAKFEFEVGKESAESTQGVSACSGNDMDSGTTIEEVSIEDQNCPSSPRGCLESESVVITTLVKSQECASACPEVDARLEDSGENTSVIPLYDTTPVTEDSPVIVDISRDALPHNVGNVKSESEVTSGPVEHASLTNSIEVIQSPHRDDPSRLASMENNAMERGPVNEVLSAVVDDSGSLSLMGHKVDSNMKQTSFFMARVPRFSDDRLKMQTQLAQQEVDEKTRSRDSIRVAMQKQKAVCTEYWRKVEDARKEERAARDVVASRRQETDSIQSILSKIKNATSISDIDNRIHNLQNRINHETNTLKEEKLLIREMNQLKQSREHLSSSLASEKELQEAFEKQELMETRLQHLKEELDTLRKEVLRAEGNTKEAKTRYDDQVQYLRGLQTQFKTADDLRQEAYTNLRNLKKESYLKNEHFYSFKDDTKTATSYTFSGDREALRSHCANQVEKIMELWNKSDEFRNQYVKANMPSTLRRFRTLDGRSLGPDEEPVIIRTVTEQRENVVFPPLPKNNTPAPVTERKQEKTDAPLAAAKVNSADEPTVTQERQSQKPKKVTKSTFWEATSTREHDKEEERETKWTIEEEKLVRKAEELARKEEELRKEVAAELKEQLRLEQIAKAKEAEERKKRKAEKVQAKAEIKALKEAELREKKREKKERKKERKVTATNTYDAGEGDVPAPPTGIPPEHVQEQPEKLVAPVSTSSKRPSRSWVATKDYNKVKPLPPPLRSRGKRKMQTWIWVLLTALVILAVFMAGNYISFSSFGLQNLSL